MNTEKKVGDDMLKYEIILYWSFEDGAYIAEVPELPGCMADGVSPHDALNCIQAMMDEWIETAKSQGRSIPRPKGRLMFV